MAYVPFCGESLHAFVVWSTATFGRNPVDDLVRIHDVARFAVYAVREVYLQTPASVAAILNHFIDSRRTKPLAGIAVLFGATCRADVRVEHVQVDRLVFVMAHRRVVNVGELVESQLAVETEIFISLLEVVVAVAVV